MTLIQLHLSAKMIIDYIRQLFSTWWGRLWLLLSLGSTVATYAVAFRPDFIVYRWIPFSLSVLAWTIAPFDVYRRQQAEIQHLNNRLIDLNERTKVETLKCDSFERWKPRHSFELTDKGQELLLESDEEFGVTGVDYLNADSTKVGSQTLSVFGRRVSVPIDFKPINEIRRIGPVLSTWDLSATVLLRLHLSKNSAEKEYVINTICKPGEQGAIRLIG